MKAVYSYPAGTLAAYFGRFTPLIFWTYAAYLLTYFEDYNYVATPTDYKY